MQYCTTMLYASRYDLNTPTIKALQWIDVNPSPNPLDSLLPADIYIKAVSWPHTDSLPVRSSAGDAKTQEGCVCTCIKRLWHWKDSCKTHYDKWNRIQNTRRAAARGKRWLKVKEWKKESIWDRHWGAVSSASIRFCVETLTVGSLGGEAREGTNTSCWNSRPVERWGFGGADWSMVPVGEQACKQGRQ